MGSRLECGGRVSLGRRKSFYTADETLRERARYTEVMQRITVGVLRGGPSSEYEVSLNSGATVLAELDRGKYDPKDLFVDKKGIWHIQGVPMPPDRALRHIDVVFNAMHGEYGEDGTVQRLLDTFGVPYTGSDAVGSALAFNKQRTKEVAVRLGVKVPQSIIVEPVSDLDRAVLDLFRSRSMPAIVKPVIGGSSVGTRLAHNFNELYDGITDAFNVSPKVLVEEYVQGKEATVGVVDDFRGEPTYPLFPTQIIIPPTCQIYDYHAKYEAPETTLRCPGDFSASEKMELQSLAQKLHQGLGLRHYSRSDFMVSPRGIYYLETNTLPGLTSHSLIPKAVKAVGTKLSEFFDHLISLARGKRR